MGISFSIQLKSESPLDGKIHFNSIEIQMRIGALDPLSDFGVGGVLGQ